MSSAATIHRQLRRVQRSAVELAEAAEAQREAVARARAAGASWAEIGRYLGMTGNAARRKFGMPPVVVEDDQEPLF